MKMFERRPGEGRVEHLVRLNTLENLGEAALMAAGAVLVSPLAGPLVVGSALAGVGAIGSNMIHERLKNKRLRTGTAKS
jgi:hypothetical protein